MGIQKFWIIPILVISWVLAEGMLFAGTWDARVDQTLHSSTFSDRDKQQVRTVFTHAEQENLPTDHFLLRLEEGVAKQVPVHTLSSALTKEIEAFTQARAIVRSTLNQHEADILLADSTSWSRIATLYQQGVSEQDLGSLITLFNQQKSEEKWSNFRYGGGLLIALRQWGIDDSNSLQVVEAIAKSLIPGNDYRLVINLFHSGFSKRISPEIIIQRIIETAPRTRSITMLQQFIQ